MTELNIAFIISRLFQIYEFLLIARILMSWVPDMLRTGIGQFLSRITDPYLDIFRRFIPPIGIIDISPIVAIFALYAIERGIYTILGSLL